MKAQSLLIITLLTLLNTNCTSQQKTQIDKNNSTYNAKQLKIEKIELKEQTRGTRRFTTFTPTSKTVSLNDNVTTFSLSADEWKKITEQVDQIKLSTISNLQAPTSARFSDGALSASISITSGDKIYTSSGFDSGVPPKELEKLYKIITTDHMGKKQ
ncbi:hypothetical protein EG347_11775 [Chryseobacterium sp. G0186]|uniref:hypothetical protein n=1 Tax=Chryseobacterium sp. G0186 TaxID=2487064 RepID=UPI000F5053EB|nr:hypothetical protein [Chryseobacterium sp. G0186]AZA78145.1 hypothetical protein EG347_11775 [Chryseobacterium sp. G0186]